MCHWISDNNFNADFLSAGVTKRNHPLPRSAALRNGLSLGRSTKRLNFRRPVSVFSPPPLRNRIAAVRRSPLRSGLPQGFIQVPLGGIFPQTSEIPPKNSRTVLIFMWLRKWLGTALPQASSVYWKWRLSPARNKRMAATAVFMRLFFCSNGRQADNVC